MLKKFSLNNKDCVKFNDVYSVSHLSHTHPRIFFIYFQINLKFLLVVQSTKIIIFKPKKKKYNIHHGLVRLGIKQENLKKHIRVYFIEKFHCQDKCLQCFHKIVGLISK